MSWLLPIETARDNLTTYPNGMSSIKRANCKRRRRMHSTFVDETYINIQSNRIQNINGYNNDDEYDMIDQYEYDVNDVSDNEDSRELVIVEDSRELAIVEEPTTIENPQTSFDCSVCGQGFTRKNNMVYHEKNCVKNKKPRKQPQNYKRKVLDE